MKIAYFDTVGGVSGDMTLGAFVSAGIPIDELRREIQKLNLIGVELEASHIVRNGITAVKVDVVISAPDTKQHRHLHQVFEIIDKSALASSVKENAKKIFRTVGEAEAKVHNTPLEKLHFHEVGMLDSIVDICGAAICIDLLKIERVYSSPVKVGQGGLITAEHGKLPNPGPATMEILKGYPVILTDIPYELTTPTGAAIIKTLSSGVLSTERFTVDSVGYGAGTREMPDVPNLLRIMTGTLSPSLVEDDVVSIETNIDDMNPEIYPFVIEQLLAAGAHDAYMIPVVMKKGRPGILLSVLTERKKMDSIMNILFAQTTTIGVRIQPVERRKVKREIAELQTRFGLTKVKKIEFDGRARFVPEFEECKRIALENKLPLIEVYKELERCIS
ncbi:MAG: nickel pincer cofactor biosynthesis protein LarC [Bacteroidota bacterium]